MKLEQRTTGDQVTHLVYPITCRCGQPLTFENAAHGRLSLSRAVLHCPPCRTRYMVTVEMTMLDPPSKGAAWA